MALVTAVVQLQSLTQELLHAAGTAKKKFILKNMLKEEITCGPQGLKYLLPGLLTESLLTAGTQCSLKKFNKLL